MAIAYCPKEKNRENDQTLNFIKSHPLMDHAVPAYGGRPIFIHTGFELTLTCIAVDWQTQAANHRFYDILYIGTEDHYTSKFCFITKTAWRWKVDASRLAWQAKSLDLMRKVSIRDRKWFGGYLVVVSGHLLVVSGHPVVVSGHHVVFSICFAVGNDFPVSVLSYGFHCLFYLCYGKF
ncbi:hypothetical protein HELRODRAFT_159301 [Helobdella robusta]|uniref:Sema domain-containing protein n=1 Tax=Helobdella robusta TaxID=6412 RepID=T1ENV0_HELRO|nr:hypothetical protein HELRODRAFT_159301 [Helobdella robusta]ESO12714.1 hypothetical protein HELRODRAFT_159301 [Helobdella robusta]